MFSRLRSGRDQSGAAAVIVAIMAAAIFMPLAAISVDIARIYVEGDRVQKAADDAALAGVTYLPSDLTDARSTAITYAGRNGYPNSGTSTVSVALGSKPTQLQVTVTSTIPNAFAASFGDGHATVSRTAVADYSAPVSMGSPCNEYGNDPDTADNARSTNCTDTGAFWANVGSPAAAKSYGDAFQDDSSSANKDYADDGYFYAVTLDQPMANVQFQIFDPALIDVGDFCTANNLAGAMKITAAHAVVPDPATRYAGSTDQTSSSAVPYCTGDIRYGGTGQVATQYTVHDPGLTGGDPSLFPIHMNGAARCQTTYPGFSGDLSKALDTSKGGYNAGVAATFRRWVPICTITNAVKGTYFIQVKTNGLGADGAQGHNRFAIRAYSPGDPASKDHVTISGYGKMALYANLPNATSKFYLARVLPGAGGQTLNINLWDVGDSTQPGTITFLPPADSNVGATFTNCVASGAYTGTLSNCQLTNVQSSYNNKWEYISIPIPKNYTCDYGSGSATACWVKLQYAYGAGNQPSDTTSWSASLGGDPVRLIQ